MLSAESNSAYEPSRYSEENQSTPRLRVFHGAQEAAPQPTNCRQSPSLDRHRRPGSRAYEIKFLLEDAQAREVEAHLSPWLSLDANANRTERGGYDISTLYCDTPDWETFRRIGCHRLFKFRLRRYGTSSDLYLERKSKRGDKVRKRRSTIAGDDLGRFAQTPAADDWNGDWYHRQLCRNRLRPACLIQYHRVAYFGSDRDNTLRLTFDRDVRGGLVDDWTFAPPSEFRSLLGDHVVCEFKFRGTMPAVFKSAMQALQLVPVGVSKFRHCLAAAGVAGMGGTHHD